MKLGFNEATALECKGQSLLADMEMCEKYGFDYIEIRFDCVRDYLKDDKIFACGGSWMVKGNLVDAGDFDKIKELTKEAADIVKEIRG